MDPAQPTAHSFAAALLRLLAVVPLCLSLLTLSAVRSSASAASSQAGVQLLQAQLPANTPVPRATCEQLTRAVTLATRAHRAEAASILTAALTRGTRPGAPSEEAKLPCGCVAALLHASVAAAPEEASGLLELASSLYPDCAETLQKAVELFNDKNVVDDKNGPVGASSAPANQTAANNPATAPNDTADPGDLNLNDPEVRDINSPGGFGPGFPGSPGFVGSAPGGGVALPSPVAPSVTPVVND